MYRIERKQDLFSITCYNVNDHTLKPTEVWSVNNKTLPELGEFMHGRGKDDVLSELEDIFYGSNRFVVHLTDTGALLPY